MGDVRTQGRWLTVDVRRMVQSIYDIAGQIPVRSSNNDIINITLRSCCHCYLLWLSNILMVANSLSFQILSSRSDDIELPGGLSIKKGS